MSVNGELILRWLVHYRGVPIVGPLSNDRFDDGSSGRGQEENSRSGSTAARHETAAL
jgi:hypothetical protein